MNLSILSEEDIDSCVKAGVVLLEVPENFSRYLLNLKTRKATMLGYVTTRFSFRQEPSKLEEAKLISQDGEDFPSEKAKQLEHMIDLTLRCLCILMFVSGACMLGFALKHKQSDQSCTAQLSTWCESR